MRFGMFGSAQAGRGGPNVDSGAGFREFVERNVEAESLGYHSTFLVEHHFTGFGQVSATLNLLTWIGARTTTLRLGTAVIVLPWHNPVLLAEQIATLDLLSNGRVDAGIGKGYRRSEFEGFCMSMDEADARFEECLEVLLKSWTSDAPWSHQGTYWRYHDVVVEPPSVQQPPSTAADGGWQPQVHQAGRQAGVQHAAGPIRFIRDDCRGSRPFQSGGRVPGAHLRPHERGGGAFREYHRISVRLRPGHRVAHSRPPPDPSSGPAG